MSNRMRTVLVVGWLAAAVSSLGADEEHLSAASRRALKYTRGPEWFCQFREMDLAPL